MAKLLEGLHGIARQHELHHLVKETRGGDLTQQPRQPRNGFRRIRVDKETKLHGEPDGPEHPHRIFPVAFLRVTNQPHHAGLVVIHAADKIHHGEVGNVVVQGIDREIPAKGILLDAAVNIVPQNPAVLEDPVTRILLVLQGTEGRDLDDFLPEMNVRQTEPATDQAAIAKYATNLFGVRIGDDVEVLRFAPQQQVTNAPTNQVGLETGFFQAIENLERVVTDLRTGDIVLRPAIDPRQPGLR